MEGKWRLEERWEMEKTGGREKKTRGGQRGGGRREEGGGRKCYKYEWKNGARGRKMRKRRNWMMTLKDIIRIKQRYNTNRINRYSKIEEQKEDKWRSKQGKEENVILILLTFPESLKH